MWGPFLVLSISMFVAVLQPGSVHCRNIKTASSMAVLGSAENVQLFQFIQSAFNPKPRYERLDLWKK